MAYCGTAVNHMPILSICELMYVEEGRQLVRLYVCKSSVALQCRMSRELIGWLKGSQCYATFTYIVSLSTVHFQR